MAYSQLGIINLALVRLGVKRIASLTENSQQALDAVAVWEYIRDEVLEQREWKFAKKRFALERRYEVPGYTYDYAYILPNDFLKRCKSQEGDASVYPDNPGLDQVNMYGEPIYTYPYTYPFTIENVPLPTGVEKLTNEAFTGNATGWTLGTGWTYGSNAVSRAAGAITTLSQAYGTMASAPVVGETYLLEFEIVAIDGGSIIPKVGGVTGEPVSTTGVKQQTFIAESATDGVTFTPSAYGVTCTIDNVSLLKIEDKLCLLTNYDDSDYPLYISYIARITDCAKYTPSFVSTLAFRLAAELSVTRTEADVKFKNMWAFYELALTRADELNQSLDSVDGEDGNTDWEDAGR